jgi:hypothetical protein
MGRRIDPANIQHWPITLDFAAVCSTGIFRDMNVFHDEHIRWYERQLRCQSPDLRFTDLDPKKPLVQIESPVYPRLMAAAEGILRSRGSLVPPQTLEWFKQIQRLQ